MWAGQPASADILPFRYRPDQFKNPPTYYDTGPIQWRLAVINQSAPHDEVNNRGYQPVPHRLLTGKILIGNFELDD